jgi:hypothetical protein
MDFGTGGIVPLARIMLGRESLFMGGQLDMARQVSRVALSVGALAAATAFRMSSYAGSKWYQAKVGGEDWGWAGQVGGLSFLPLAGVFFVGDLIAKMIKGEPHDYQPTDWAQGALAMQRLNGVGLMATEFMAGLNMGNVPEKLADAFGAFMGGWTAPLNPAHDVLAGLSPALTPLSERVAGVSEEEAKRRDYKDTMAGRMFGPMISNIPLVNQAFPEKADIWSEKAQKDDHPLIRQVTGLNFDDFNFVKQEAGRLGIDPKTVMPKTGSNEVNRIESEEIGKSFTKHLKRFMSDPKYQDADIPAQKIMFGKGIEQAKRMALIRGKRRAMKEAPEEMRRLKLEKKPRTLGELKRQRAALATSP